MKQRSKNQLKNTYIAFLLVDKADSSLLADKADFEFS